MNNINTPTTKQKDQHNTQKHKRRKTQKTKKKKTQQPQTSNKHYEKKT